MRSQIGMFDSFGLFKVYRCQYCDRRVWPWQAKTDALDHQECHDEEIGEELRNALPTIIADFKAIRERSGAFGRTTR